MTSTTTSDSPSLPPTDPPPPQFTLPSPFTKTTPPPILITQGAEALLYHTHFLTPSHPAALKFRPSKSYRHPTLDARLTKQRVLAEARVLVKLCSLEASDGVRVPAVLSLEWDVGRKVKGVAPEQRGERGQGAWILMEWIEGKSVRELLREWDGWVKGVDVHGERGREIVRVQEEEVKRLLRRLGRAVGAMHAKGGVVHGDLTSSNIMIRPVKAEQNGRTNRVAYGNENEDEGLQSAPRATDLNGEVVLIDFGLAIQSVQDEDRAVDLYVLERAFGSTHPRQEGWFDAEVLQSQDGYKGSFKGSNVVLKRLDEVRLRGRKRSMVG